MSQVPAEPFVIPRLFTRLFSIIMLSCGAAVLFGVSFRVNLAVSEGLTVGLLVGWYYFALRLRERREAAEAARAAKATASPLK